MFLHPNCYETVSPMSQTRKSTVISGILYHAGQSVQWDHNLGGETNRLTLFFPLVLLLLGASLYNRQHQVILGKATQEYTFLIHDRETLNVTYQEFAQRFTQ